MSNDKIKATQRDATCNQSTVDFERRNPFLFGNRKCNAVLNNNTGADLEAISGFLVTRNTGTAGEIFPAQAGNLADVIGILDMSCVTTLADGETTNTCYAISGDIDATLLTLPAGVTLDTVVGNKVLKDILTDLGFILHNVTENTKFDN